MSNDPGRCGEPHQHSQTDSQSVSGPLMRALLVLCRSKRSAIGVAVLLLLIGVTGASGAAAVQDLDGTGSADMAPLTFFITLLIATTLVGIFAVLGGVGGGVVFTPLLMGFTSIDSYIIRSTGLFIAIAGSLIASRAYLGRGVANTRLLLTGAVPYTAFAVVGALLAGYIEASMGNAGEAFIQGALGIIVLSIGCLFILYGGRTDYPEVQHVDNFTTRLDLALPYWEASLGKIVHYNLTRTPIALALFCLVGLISGLFGLGAGGAIVCVFNMVMMAPLKVAATTSSVMISLGGTAAVWPYVVGGGMFPLLAVPCMIGLIVGAFIGSSIMLKVKAGFVRWIIVVVMLGAGIRLIVKAINIL